MDFAAMFIKLITKNGLVAAFIIIGITTWIAYKIGGLTKGRIHGSAIAIFFGLILAYIGGVVGGGHKGLASIPMFAALVLWAELCSVILPSFPLLLALTCVKSKKLVL